ncbi:putative baseplate assembly protein [Natrialbaceae archaeon AArc-T1-2]|uniref:putative baseplate assembly protein n=1 Tax=Natrialbaceae archaeon AArc-T1-2 TaxID=3053904 RepID=UPI00255B222D|nr:putative baseplate assembly protein [Natrialbaceae archaeon AArc-T1-2]WIV66074.1 putative baseplate assembly protein [Natrialbaceae archaeon AArc-T1-2]
MSDGPDIDGRSRDDVAERARSIAPAYADEWEPHEDGPGTVLLELFADMAGDVVERLDQVPEKHRISFLDTVGFDRDPPQSAEAPVRFEIADGADDNVRVPSGTQVTAGATDDRPKQVFEIEDGFEATPANLERVYSVDPAEDVIVEHTPLLTDRSKTELFSAEPPQRPNRQRHALYIGHEDRLDLGPGASLELVVDTRATEDTLETLVWEFFGTRGDEEGWHPFPGSVDVQQLVHIEEFVEALDFETIDRYAAAGDAASILAYFDNRLAEFGLREVFYRSDPEETVSRMFNLEPSDWQALVETPTVQLVVDVQIFLQEVDYGSIHGYLTGEGTQPLLEYLFDRISDVGLESVPKPGDTRNVLARLLAEETEGGSFPEVPDTRLVVDVEDVLTDIDSPVFPRRITDEDIESATERIEQRLSQLGLDGVVTTTEPDDDFSGLLQDVVTESELRRVLETSHPHLVIADRPGTSRRCQSLQISLMMDADGSIAETTVGDTESRWLRCRVPPDVDESDLFDLVVGCRGRSENDDEYSPIRLAAKATEISPQRLLANDVPQPIESDDGSAEIDDEIRPFGDQPRIQDAFYVASRNAFTKGGTEVSITFNGDGVEELNTEDDPRLSWEYFDGDGWNRIFDVEDGTNQFQRSGDVTFSVPSDLEPTSVAGHEHHWIRIRLIGGDYGGIVAREADGEWSTATAYDPPSYDEISLSLSADEYRNPANVLSENNLEYSLDLIGEGTDQFRPFLGRPEDGQTLYLGFDAPLEDGPVNVLVEPTDQTYPRSFEPRVRWEYRVDGSDDWIRADVVDGSEGLTQLGLVTLGFDEPTRRSHLFDEELHWIRARVTREQFGDGETRQTHQSGDSTPSGVPDPCETTVRTASPTGPPGLHRPILQSVVTNAAWARNEHTTEEEIVGSSDGSANQTFAVSGPPILDASVWIDESTALGPTSRGELLEQLPDRVDVVGDPEGDPVAVWVEWSRQPHLFESDGADRHYELDPVAGRITFGDDTRGKIPPEGTDNVRITYTTGGGSGGNVEPGAIDGLRRSIQFVKKVENPLAGTGGVDVESTSAVGERAPRTLRDRGRAVTPVDVERIARTTSRQLERVRCLPGMDIYGEETPGWVTLIVVPGGPGDRPLPSAALKRRVKAVVSEQAPLGLDESDQLVVRGPSYVAIDVDTTVVLAGGESLSRVEETIERRVSTFLDPLSGSPDGGGWPFGRLPRPSHLYGLLENVEGVDYVDNLVLQVQGDDRIHEVREGEPPPGVAADTLVYSGSHEVVARFGQTERPNPEGS